MLSFTAWRATPAKASSAVSLTVSAVFTRGSLFRALHGRHREGCDPLATPYEAHRLVRRELHVHLERGEAHHLGEPGPDRVAVGAELRRLAEDGRVEVTDRPA